MNTHAIADFNGDRHLDLIFADGNQNYVRVLLGMGNGTFHKVLTFPFACYYDQNHVNVGDFNNDNYPDLVITNSENECISIILNYKNKFWKEISLGYLGPNRTPVETVVGHFNDDRCLDIAGLFSIDNSVGVFFGQCNGTFFKPMLLYTGTNSYPIRITTADFNCDGLQDIAVINKKARNIGIMLGNRGGTFQIQKISFTGGYHYPLYFAVDDFNDDTWPDIAVTYEAKSFINVMFGYGNGTVSGSTTFDFTDASIEHPILVKDFNGDHHLDIGFGRNGRNMMLLVGHSDGTFELQTVLTTMYDDKHSWIDIGDFNDDGHDDLVCMISLLDSQKIYFNICG